MWPTEIKQPVETVRKFCSWEGVPQLLISMIWDWFKMRPDTMLSSCFCYLYFSLYVFTLIYREQFAVFEAHLIILRYEISIIQIPIIQLVTFSAHPPLPRNKTHLSLPFPPPPATPRFLRFVVVPFFMCLQGIPNNEHNNTFCCPQYSRYLYSGTCISDFVWSMTVWLLWRH